MLSMCASYKISNIIYSYNVGSKAAFDKRLLIFPSLHLDWREAARAQGQ